MTLRPTTFTDLATCVDATLERVGRRIVLGTPLGLGKANHIVNEFFRRARADPRMDLRIFTALTLGKPRWKSELERRFIEPLAQRLFGDYPELDYAQALRQGNLPANIRVNEFYFHPGAWLTNPLAQQQYVSSNYTHVVRDLLDAGINVLAQLVAKSEENGALRYSLSCNPDLTLDLVPELQAAKRRGQPVALLGQVNRNLPFMYGDADVAPDYFDAIVDHPRYDFPLFAPPNPAVAPADYMMALHVSALVRDGGTLQLGIGSLGDAVTYLLKLRHEQNGVYRDVIATTGVVDRSGELVARIGGTGAFDEGLYGATEMLVPGFLELRKCGVLKRSVVDRSGRPAFTHACFFLGPQSFYDALRAMDRSEREQICMTSISFVNQLYGDEDLKRRQRRNARFINTGLFVTLTGAVTSDALEDGRVVSGVGGQYNFVAMAHALEDGRAILLIRATREEGRTLRSNIRAQYGAATIPRHLRDIVVTEYGIADLRGRTDEEVAIALIQIADSRFQDSLLEAARNAGKVRSNYQVPEQWRNNRPEALNNMLAPYRARGLFPAFPFGTDLTHEEIVLMHALQSLKRMAARKRLPIRTSHFRKLASIPPAAHPYLERMDLTTPRTIKERILQRAVIFALAADDAI